LDGFYSVVVYVGLLNNMESFDFVQPLRDEIKFLGHRMERIELALNKILERLGLDGQDESMAANAEAETKLPLIETAPVEFSNDKQGIKEKETQQNAASASSVLTDTAVSEATGAYTYTSLDATKSQIRILSIRHAANFSDPIIAHLKTIDLDDNQSFQSYTALSYCWGAPVMDGGIVLSGHHFPITTSLESALRHLRSEKTAYSYKAADEDWYWIDQVCINQADIDERGSMYNPDKKSSCW
jgi:hypothetical protein